MIEFWASLERNDCKVTCTLQVESSVSDKIQGARFKWGRSKICFLD